MSIIEKKRLEEIICENIAKNGDFPFELFSIKKEDIGSQERYKFDVPHTISSNDSIIIVSYNGDDISFHKITEVSEECALYFSSSFRKVNGNILEYKRTIKSISIKKPNYDLGKALSDLMHEDEREVTSSKRMVRDFTDPKFVDLEYSCCLPYPTKAYDRVELESKSECLLSRCGDFNPNEIVEKTKEAIIHEKEREKYRKSILALNDSSVLDRNKRFTKFVSDGLTLKETFAIVRSFVEELPGSIDPMSGSFFPGEAFFQQPIDIKQLNYKRFDFDGYRTIFDGMIKWSDTRQTARTIALCVFFQRMLLSGNTNYSTDELKGYMKGIMLPTEGMEKDEEYIEFATKRNALLDEIARKMVEDVKIVSEKTGQDREEALKIAYSNIKRAEGIYPLIKDIELYYESNCIPKHIKVNGIDKIGESSTPLTREEIPIELKKEI